ncbi:MAG: hypothetical protein IJS39_11675 [Synergistaceae bacterium]|nr:hypothetical protein [Synergistaceae bacterium]
MKAQGIKISNTGENMDEALNITEKAAESMGLNSRDTLRLRLLAEEMMSMVRAITGSFTADFWLEHEGRNCKMILSAKSDLDYGKRSEFLSVSTSGKNTAKVGIMEKIRGIFEAGLYGMEQSFAAQAEYGVGMYGVGMMGAADAGMTEAIYAWSMQKYKDEIAANRTEYPDVWDELEKSIIANIADDVSVGARKDGVMLVVQKNFSD